MGLSATGVALDSGVYCIGCRFGLSTKLEDIAACIEGLTPTEISLRPPRVTPLSESSQRLIARFVQPAGVPQDTLSARWFHQGQMIIVDGRALA